MAANLFRPEGASEDERFPALLEYLPYRKDEWGLARDYSVHGYFARRGYVGARVDIRGTGRSEGRTPECEYSEREQLDGLEVIEWLSRQPWCSGRVGMFGISWGGFNAIHLAMRRPPALRAILAVDATDDLFQDDVHYIDGLMHFDPYMLGIDHDNGITRSPEFPTDPKSLEERFDNPPWSLLYLRHQRDGSFWRRTALVDRYDTIRIPTMMIGGWLDGYRDSIPRMLERLDAPTKALVGPWNHAFPNDAVPGPNLEWRREAVRWWDAWLKDRDTGVSAEPRLAVYLRDWHPPGLDLKAVPGTWRWETGWPPANAGAQTFFLSPDRSLASTPAAAGVHELAYVPSSGFAGGFWWGDLTPDQRDADAYALVYDSAPLEAGLAVLGLPRARLRVSADAPLAHWFARLSDVSPDGRATLVTGAGFNGAHRFSAAEPRPLVPGEPFDLELELHFTSWTFPRGHRVRLAVSNALWPMIWPTPHPMVTRLEVGGGPLGSRLELPRIASAPDPSPLGEPRFAAPARSDRPKGTRAWGEYWPGRWVWERDEPHRTSRLTWRARYGVRFPWGRETNRQSVVWQVADDSPATASVEGRAETAIALPERSRLWRTEIDIRSDAAAFHYRARREVRDGGTVVRERVWTEDVPRDCQ